MKLSLRLSIPFARPNVGATLFNPVVGAGK